MRLNEIYERFRDKIHFFCLYIQEAHPEDGWQRPQNVFDSVVFNQPTTMGERASVAEACVLRLELAMPTLLDDMENSTDLAYAALPERLYVVGSDGRVAYKSGPGPFGFDLNGWEQVIFSLAAG